MNRTEVAKVLGRIKSHYNYFTFEDYTIDEWLRYLKPYENYDVNLKLDSYFDDKKERPPTIKYLVTYLQTPEQKRANKNDFKIACNLCQKFMTLNEYDNHYDKCSSINYLLNIFKKNKMNVKYEELEKLDDGKFNSVYKKYESKGSDKNVNDKNGI